MSRACVLPVVPEVVRPLRGRASLQLASVEGAFVGRERELAELAGALAGGARRIWISGESGLGKTELLSQLVRRWRDRGLRYHWLAPHEPATPAVLRAVAGELGRGASRGGQRLLVIDDFARLRPAEPWFVERFLPALPAGVTVVVADRAAAPAWRGDEGGGLALALAPLGDDDAARYLALRGVPGERIAELIAGADGIPAILAAAADAAGPPLPAARAFIDAGAKFYVRHDSDDHRLALALLVASRTAPYELLELAFDDPHAARDAYAWLSRLSVVESTPNGLRPDTLLRKAWERELVDRVPALWARARAAARAFAEHRIAMAYEPQRWLLDRLFVDRDAPGLRAFATLPAGDPGLAIAALGDGDRAAVAGLAAAAHGAHGAAAIARWLDDERAAFDVVRDARGEVQGYLCSVAITAAAEPPAGDPAIDQCVAHLASIGWFGLATPPDARALVVRDWTVAGAHQAPSAGAALVLAQIASRLLASPEVELQFAVTEQPAAWQSLLRFLGLAVEVAGEHTWGDRRCSVLAIDCRGVSLAQVLHAASEAAAAPPAAPAITAAPVVAAAPTAVVAVAAAPAAIMAAPVVAAAPAPAMAAATAAAAAPAVEAPARGVVAAGSSPAIAVAVGTRPLPVDAIVAAHAAAASAATPGATSGLATDPSRVAGNEARDLSIALERRVAQLARSAALSPREQEVLQLLLLGRNYTEIGTALQITPRTARFHQHNVLEKIGAESRLDLVRLML